MKKLRSIRPVRAAFLSTAVAALLAAGLMAPHPAQGLTTSIWDGSTNNWSVPAHWSTNPAFPNDGGGIFYDARVNAGSVSVDGGFTVTDFTLTGGAVAGNNLLTVSGAISFTGGNFGDGTATGTTRGPLAVDLTASGQGIIKLNYTLANTGAGSWTGTGNFFNDGGTLANSGTFTISNNQGLLNSTNIGAFNNTGTVIKTTAIGTTGIHSVFNNTGGTVDVQSGIVSLLGGGAATGNAKFGGTGSGVLSFDGGTFTMAGTTSFTGTGFTQVTSGTVAINSPVSATNFMVAGGAVAGNSTLTASGVVKFTGGNFGDGTATGTTSGPLAVDLTASGQGFIKLNYTLANTGAGTWAGTGNFFNDGGTLANSGTFTISNNQGLLNSTNIGAFNNTGTVIKTTAIGTTGIHSVFNNTGGTVDVQSGIVSLLGGGAATGNAKFGGTGSGVLSFDGGTFTMAGTTSFTGTGFTRVTSGTVAINSPLSATNFMVTGGAVAGNSTLTASGVVSFTGGNFGDGAATGTTSGPLAVDFSASGQGFIKLNYTLANTGAGSWTGIGNFFNDGGTLANSGTFTISNNQSLLNFTNTGAFNNTGTVIKTTATGTTGIQSAFNNTGGTVDVQSGIVSLRGGGAATSNAKFGGTSSGVLSFDGGTFTMAGGTSFTGTGVTRLTVGTVAINGPVSATNFTVTGGAVAGNGTLTASGVVSFTGGTFGDGTATGTTSGPLAVDLTTSGQGFIKLNYTLANTGAGTWTGTGNFFNDGGTLANSGTFTITNDQSLLNFNNTGAFNNTGTVTKITATGTTGIQSVFNNTGGTVDVQSGTINLSGAATNFNGSTHTLTGGTWKATGAGATLSIDFGGGNRAINTLAGGADVTVGNATATVTGLAVTNIGSGSALRSTSGAAVTSGGPLTNSGTVEVGTGSTLDVKSGGVAALFTQNGGDLLLTGGTLTASAFAITGGKIEGSGNLNVGDVTASGTALLSPGQSIGHINIGGSLSQTAGTGLFELGRSGGLPVADILAAQGNVGFSNVTITLALAAGSAPLQLNDTFTLFQANSNSGGGSLTLTNDTFVQDSSLAGYTLAPFQTATTYGYTVTGVPEPGSGILAATGLLGLLAIRPRRRTRD